MIGALAGLHYACKRTTLKIIYEHLDQLAISTQVKKIMN
jgi:hypothetical protein